MKWDMSQPPIRVIPFSCAIFFQSVYGEGDKIKMQNYCLNTFW
jgi:hypothetical protein